MINEMIFFSQIILLIAVIHLSYRLGVASMVSCLALQSILANFMVLKKVMLFGFDVTAADSFAVGGILCINIIREYFGESSSRAAMYTCWLWMLVSVFLFKLHILFAPSTSDSMHLHYLALLDPVCLITLQSFLIILCIQVFDYQLFGLLKTLCASWSFSLRSTISLLVSQALDTFLFTYVLSNAITIDFIHIFIWSYMLKCIVVLCMSTWMGLLTAVNRGDLSVV